MKVLGIETATAVCATAIVDGENILSESILDSPRMHSEKLMEMINDCLLNARLELALLDGIAVSIGPGSFTGLRIGLSVAKGLSYSAGIPLVSVSTLKAIAWHAVYSNIVCPSDLILPLIDARRDDVYTSLYKWDGNNLEEILPPITLSLKEIANRIPQQNRIIVLGDNAEKYLKVICHDENYNFSDYINASNEFHSYNARTVAMLGMRNLNSDLTEDIAAIEPLYMKDFYILVKSQHQKAIT